MIIDNNYNIYRPAAAANCAASPIVRVVAHIRRNPLTKRLQYGTAEVVVRRSCGGGNSIAWKMMYCGSFYYLFHSAFGFFWDTIFFFFLFIITLDRTPCNLSGESRRHI